MTALFLICALALSTDKQALYDEIIEYVEKRHPDYKIVFVDEDFPLKNAEMTPITVMGKRMWAVRRTA